MTDNYNNSPFEGAWIPCSTQRVQIVISVRRFCVIHIFLEQEVPFVRSTVCYSACPSLFAHARCDFGSILPPRFKMFLGSCNCELFACATCSIDTLRRRFVHHFSSEQGGEPLTVMKRKFQVKAIQKRSNVRDCGKNESWKTYVNF